MSNSVARHIQANIPTKCINFYTKCMAINKSWQYSCLSQQMWVDKRFISELLSLHILWHSSSSNGRSFVPRSKYDVLSTRINMLYCPPKSDYLALNNVHNFPPATCKQNVQIINNCINNIMDANWFNQKALLFSTLSQCSHIIFKTTHS